MHGYNFDVLIIGSGLAGLTAAIKLLEANKKVAIITREKDPNISNTFWAQGGIIYSAPNNDDPKEFAFDIMRAGSFTSNEKAIEILVNQSGEILEEIFFKKANVQFSTDELGKLKYTREAAHSRDRIIYKGDYTGKEIQISLLNYLKDKARFPGLTFFTGHTAIDLITPSHHGVSFKQRYEDNVVIGAYVFNQSTGEVLKIMAKKVILATGGIGALYLHHSNSFSSRGDGVAMAKRAGAFVNNMEFVQFHPTTFFDSSSHRRFLISEAVRGEGGVLTNRKGERFMKKYHPDAELAPRDVVARAILEEMIENGDDFVYLDISHKNETWLRERFPTIYDHCLANKIDITKGPIPVVPAAHYTCGGVKVDLNGRTNLKNLYAVGEVACSGLHGANRLASTSLLECLTFGYLAAMDIVKFDSSTEENYPAEKIKNWELAKGECDLSLIAQDWMTLRQTMWNYVGLARSTNRLARARAMFLELQDEINRFYRHSMLHDELIGLRNGVEVAFMVLNSSLRNKESVGCFYLRR